MLGYVRVEPSELLVKHDRLYHALYCGLCDTIEKKVTRALSPFLSYDFVFLAALRLIAVGEKTAVSKKRCPFHPTKKKAIILPNESLVFTGRMHLILVLEKMRDDLGDPDHGFFKKLFLRFYARILSGKLKRLVKKDSEAATVSDFVSQKLAESREWEKRRADLDKLCADFGEVLGFIASAELPEEKERERKILSRFGDMLGRFIYTVDALDDLENDFKKGAYNPLLHQYGTPEKARQHIEEIDMVLAVYIREMDAALSLLPYSPDFTPIIENVLRHGLKKQIRRAAIKENGEMK